MPAFWNLAPEVWINDSSFQRWNIFSRFQLELIFVSPYYYTNWNYNSVKYVLTVFKFSYINIYRHNFRGQFPLIFGHLVIKRWILWSSDSLLSVSNVYTNIFILSVKCCWAIVFHGWVSNSSWNLICIFSIGI